MDSLKSGKNLDFHEKLLVGLDFGFRNWLFLSAALGVTAAIMAIAYVWLYDLQVQNGYRLAKLYHEQEQLLATQRKLRLEWCRFEDPYKLEEMGRNQFGLQPPRADQKFMMR
ncbi:hypothetical protein [Desulforhabdus sp. TSK]|uniref:hypothetical protein n=1 Tax=Desulforhabdus sp. TSK TaxID=2925014 RepID=UPI001FC8DA3D|nr:hypothetical protein [Desulforhabdus sp. TSK]GKT08237.1 hypothetical protein DSTSK_15420 [Desulforhabdus sp. TSK]